jgi:hypothetical protein
VTRAPATVAVFGSCITRDNFNSRFNPGYKDRFVCPLHQNQSSLIALMSPPVAVDWEPLNPEMSEYDRWNVRTEFDRSFLAELVALRPELLVLDFFGDVHFGVVRMDDGRYVTDNRWKIRPTTWYRDANEAGSITPIGWRDDHDAYLELWRDAFDRFIALVRAELPGTTVVLHRGRNTNAVRLPDGSTIKLQANRSVAPLPVQRANRLWAELDDYASSRVDRVIDLRARRYPTYDEHPWGPFYVHYVPEYYTSFLDWLTDIDDAERGGLQARWSAKRSLARRV